MRYLKKIQAINVFLVLFLFLSSCSKQSPADTSKEGTDHPTGAIDGISLTADTHTLCAGAKTTLSIHTEDSDTNIKNIEWKCEHGSISGKGNKVDYHAPEEIPESRVDRVEVAFTIDGESRNLSANILILDQAESRDWVQTNGPTGGIINVVEVSHENSRVLYAAGHGGLVYKSEDGGEFWRALPEITSENDVIYSILLPKKDPNVVFAAAGSGLYKSIDGGESWSRIEDTAAQCPTAVDLYENGDTYLVIGDCEGLVYFSEDSGENWERIGSGFTNGRRINNITIADGDTIWVSCEDESSGDLFRTTNLGETWEQVDFGKPEHLRVYSLYVDKEDPNSIYVGTMDVHNETLSEEDDPPLFVSHDGGDSWEENTSIEREWLDTHLAVIGREGSDNALFIASQGRIAKSYDNGETWEHLNPPQPSGDIYDLAVDPKNADVVYVPRRLTGIIKSTDGGQTFKPINNGLHNVGVSLLAVPEETGSGDVYTVAINGEGVFRSFDYGNTWENITGGGISHPWPDEITVSPHDPAEIWYTADVGQVFKSTDHGESWKMIIDTYGEGFRYGTTSILASPASNHEIIYGVKNGFGIFKFDPSEGHEWRYLHQSDVDYTYTLAVHPQNPDIIFSGFNPKPFQDWAMVRRSTDGGENWETVLEVPGSYGITSVVFDKNNPETLYAGSTAGSESGGGKIFISTNGGDTWEELNPKFNMNTIWGQPQLIIKPGDPSTAYAATWLAGTWRTSDGGENWELLENAPLSVTSLSIDAEDPETIYLANRASPHLWKSMDGGNSWNAVADFSTDGAFLVNRVFAYQGNIFASTFGPDIHGGKLYRSKDDGDTWEDITGNLPRSVLDIAAHPGNADIYYVTTHIFGAYQTNDGGESWKEIVGYPNIGGYDIEIDPENPDILYTAGMGGMEVPDWVMPPNGYSFSNTSGVYRSNDGGKNWTQLLETSNESRAVRLHPENSDVVFTSALDGGMHLSMDGGATWQEYNRGLDTTVLTSVAVMDDKVYVGTQGFGVYGGDFDKETGTVSWAPARGNKPVPPVYNLQISIDPTNPLRIFVGSNPGGLYRSDDGGETFYDKNFLTPSVVVDDPLRQGYYTFSINTNDPEEVWVGTWGKGIYKSYDGMDFNTPASGGRDLYGKHINAILVSERYGVLAATEEGVFRSTDGGAGWKEFSEGLHGKQVRSIVETSDGRLLCGTAGYEIFEREMESDWSQFAGFGNFGTFWPLWDDRPMYQYTSLLFHPSEPNVMLLGTFPAGIYKSTDGGDTWFESNTGWTNDGVFSLVYHPEDENIIYSGTYNGVNRSIDGGEHWEMWDNGWPDEQWGFSIDFDPSNPDVMYACSKNGEEMGRGVEDFHGTVMKSEDGGKNWFQITEGLDISQEFYKIIVDRFDPQTVYLATQWDGVHISHNGGESWAPWNEGLTNLNAGTNGNNVTNTMILSEDGLHLYFGTAGTGVFRRLTAHADAQCGCQ